jgi:DNA modification methylase
MMFNRVEIFQSDVLRQGIPLPDQHVHCVATSPPYFGLRNYQVDGQIGAEKLHDCMGWARGGDGCGECYVCHIVGVFRHVKRVLRDAGTAWLNLGDSFATNPGKGGNVPQTKWKSNSYPDAAAHRSERLPGLKTKDLMGIPWRVAFALQADGWYMSGKGAA